MAKGCKPTPGQQKCGSSNCRKAVGRSDQILMSARLFHTRFARAIALPVTFGLLCTAANAMTLRELRALEKNDKQGENYVNYYLVGVMEGVLETDAHRVRDGAKPTICLNGRRLQPSMARSLFDTELQRNDGVYEADMPVQLVLRNALATVYSC